MTGKISFKEINRLAIPAIFAGIVEPLISLTDTAVAGRFTANPDEALGAIGLVGSFLSALIWIFLQTSNAISALVSHAYGQDKVERLKTLVSQLFYFNLVVSLVMSFSAFFLAEWILSLYGAKNLLLEIAVDYFKVRVWGFPLTLLTFTIFGVFRGLQNTSWAMRISIFGGIFNATLDIILVYVFNFDVVGIAWASVTAQFIMFMLAMRYLYLKTPFRLMKLLPLHEDFSKTLMMSFDLFIRTLSLNIALFLGYRYATLLGSEGNNQFVGAHAILIQVWMFSSFLLDGYAHAGSAISGKLFGARDYKELNYLVKRLIGVMLILGVSLMGIYLVLSEPIGRLLTKSEDVLIVFFSAFWLVAIMQPINSLAFLFDGIYKGLGETKVLRNLLVIALIFGFIPTLLLANYFEWGVLGIWLSFMVWMLFRSGGLVYHFKKHYSVKAKNQNSED